MTTVTESPVTVSLPELIRLQAEARALKLPSALPVRSRPAGLKRSPRWGRGMAFAEVRQYQPGDDIRSIDWRVTARRQEPHTKLYEEERERPVLLLCDLGPSLFFGSGGAYKQVRAAQVTAMLAWLALWGGDQVGGIIFNGDNLVVQRPARRKKSVLRLLDRVARMQHFPGTLSGTGVSGAGLDTALAEARRVANTGSQIMLISDFLSLTEQTPRLLGSLARNNTVGALRIIDPLEQQLPASGRFAVAGPDGPVWFDASDRRFRQAWDEKVAHHEQQFRECFRTAGIAPATLLTTEDPAWALQPLLGPRGRIG
ncbi:MAG: DUF58 domain-containing protein [Pseudomonadota bacterium]|nr:DUF58 domain-containing protein [Pseudomonadota bacterium]